MESALQQLIAEYLLGGGKAGQQDPAQQGQGKQNPQGKNQVSGGQLQFLLPAHRFPVQFFFFLK